MDASKRTSRNGKEADDSRTADAENYFEEIVADAFHNLIDEIATGDDVDPHALLAFRERLVELDTLLEDAVQTEGSTDIETAPPWSVQDTARDLFALAVQNTRQPTRRGFTTIWERANALEDDLDAWATGTLGDQASGGLTAEPKFARPVVTIQDDPLHVVNYPEISGDATGEISISTRETEGEVKLSADASDEQQSVGASIIMDAETAEWLAGQLPQFAERARNGEPWLFNV